MGAKSTVSASRSRSISRAIGASRASVYRMAAGGVVVDRAEVALAVDERVAQREVLRHADERVVDRRVAVRVVLAHHVADDAGALDVRAVRLQAVLVHREQDAAVDGLQAVADVGQRAPDDDGHGVVEVGGAHLLLEPARLDVAAADQVVDMRHSVADCLASDVEGGDAGVLLDELAARLDLVAHQHREQPVGRRRRPPS